MWTVTATKKKLTGPLGTYNSLTDQHLTHYFNNPAIKRQLRKTGLINKEGKIIPDSVQHIQQQEEQRRKQAHEFIANAIVQKTLELERLRQAEIKHHLEDMNKIELVERVKSARTKSRKDRTLSHQSACNFTRSAECLESSLLQNELEQSDRWKKSSFTLNYNLPNNLLPNKTNIDKIKVNNLDQQYFEVHSKRKGSSARPHIRDRSKEILNYHLRSKSANARLKNSENFNKIYKNAFKALIDSSVSPYLLPVFSKNNTFLNNQQHKTFNQKRNKIKRNVRQSKHLKSSEEITAVESCKLDENSNKINEMEYLKIKKPVLRISESPCKVTLCYHGAFAAPPWMLQNVSIMQQHCGGNTICVFKNQLQAQDVFTFVSRRHCGYPFSIIIFISGIRHFHLSACCEYRHQLGSRLGGKRGQFTLVDVHGGTPCFRCQVEDSLGITRPRHPPLPEYSKFLQKSKRRTDIQKQTVWNTSIDKKSTKSINLITKPNETSILPVDHHQSLEDNKESFQHNDSEIDNKAQIEEIFSENDDDEIEEDLKIDANDQEVQLSESDVEECIEEEKVKEDSEKEEICEVVEEETEPINALSQVPFRESFGEDDIPYHETCMSFEYNADSEEELSDDKQNTSDKKKNFCKQNSQYKSDDNSYDVSYEEEVQEEEEEEEEEEEILNKRKESIDDIEENILYSTNEWKHKTESGQSYSFSSDEEDEGVLQQIVTADVHVDSVDVHKRK